MFHRLYSRFIYWIIRFLQLQLFISLMSLPILISWGLPFSLLSPLGNLIFTPFIMLFLLLSTFIFFSELLYIPNGLCIHCLENIYNLWIGIMNYISFNPLIGFPKPHIIFLIGLPVMTVAILRVRIFKGIYRNLLCMLTLFVGSCSYMIWLQPPDQLYTTLACNKGNITIIYNRGKLAVIDPGYIGQNKSAESWLQYSLMPYITSNTGKTVIDHFILLQPTKTLFKALTTLAQEKIIDKIYMPLIQNKRDKDIQECKISCRKNNCRLIEISDQPVSCKLSTTGLTMLSVNKWLYSKPFRYPSLKVVCSHEDICTEILPAKCTHKPPNTSNKRHSSSKP